MDESMKIFWNLMTGKREGDLEYKRTYTSKDLLQHLRLVGQTNVLHQDFYPDNSHPRANNS